MSCQDDNRQRNGKSLKQNRKLLIIIYRTYIAKCIRKLYKYAMLMGNAVRQLALQYHTIHGTALAILRQQFLSLYGQNRNLTSYTVLFKIRSGTVF